MKAIIDADTIAFATAATAEEFDTADIACSRAEEMVRNVLDAVSATEYEILISGKGNFRHAIYPEYKANRHDAFRPKHEKAVKQFLIDYWNAEVVNGIEADDMCGIRLCAQKDAILCHIDKDLNQIPGLHYNWELRRLGAVVREAKQYYVTLEEANYNFYYQLLVGDPTDNIKGVSGIGPKKAAKLLESTQPENWYDTVRDLYSSEEELDMNAQCAYIWRKENDNWKNLTHKQDTHDQLEDRQPGQKDAYKDS